MDQKPSQGRIVIVPVNPELNNGADTASAIITRVWSDTVVNVRVFLDASNETPARTSVALYPTADEAVTSGQHVAWWPPRV